MQKRHSKSLLYLLCICFLQFTAKKRNYGFRVNFLNYTLFRDDFATNISFSYHNVRNLIKLNTEFVPLQDVGSGLMFNFTFDALRKDNTKMKFLNFKLDGCKVMENIYNNTLILIVLKELRRSSNLPKRCPFLKNHKYFVKNFTIDPESYPPFIPMLNFAWQLHMRKGELNYGNIYAEGRVYKT